MSFLSLFGKQQKQSKQQTLSFYAEKQRDAEIRQALVSELTNHFWEHVVSRHATQENLAVFQGLSSLGNAFSYLSSYYWAKHCWIEFEKEYYKQQYEDNFNKKCYWEQSYAKRKVEVAEFLARHNSNLNTSLSIEEP